MDISPFIIAFSSSLWELFKQWLFIFVEPFTQFDVAWIIVPIWLAFIFAEFFQEKEGTSFGNAISNGVVSLWVSVDWMRYITGQIVRGEAVFSGMLVLKYGIAVIVLGYGLLIIIAGIQTKKMVAYVGRIREVTYVLLMFTPFVYGIIELEWNYVFAILIFAPLFYGIIEVCDRYLPTPRAMHEEKKSTPKTTRF
ncbi:hypothetical protein HZB02_03775 [Candidatus Woesearchaeota archaeon]|nr:hypothetical protein [Candidatus Woesearchaeota archaeon]